MADITRILEAVQQGDSTATAELFPAIYEELRYFAGLSFDEAAAVLGIAVPTAKQWWAYSRAWLAVEMRSPGPR